MRHSRTALLALAALTGACEIDPADRIINFVPTATVQGVAFLDANRNGSFEVAVDERLTNIAVEVRRPGALEVVASATTDTAGLFQVPVPIGSYEVHLAASVLGDSLEVAGGVPSFTVDAQNNTATVAAGVRFRTVSPAEARALPQGTKVWLRGIALNAPALFGDSTVHVADAAATIRVTGVRPGGIGIGDSIFVLGTRSTRLGQPTLQVVSCHPSRPNCFLVNAGITFVPDTADVTAAQATSAGGGALDGALVRLAGATIADTATAADGSFELTVSDGAGTATVVLSQSINWNPIVTYTPPVVLDVVGVLVPTGTGSWVIKPRGRTDLTVQP